MLEKARTSFTARLGCFVIFFVLGTIFQNGIFHNIAWVLYGLSMIVLPCWPRAWDYTDHEKLKLGCRIAGALAVAVGLLTRFGA